MIPDPGSDTKASCRAKAQCVCEMLALFSSYLSKLFLPTIVQSIELVIGDQWSMWLVVNVGCCDWRRW